MVHYFFNGMLLFTTILFRADPSKYGDAIQSGTQVSLFEHAFVTNVKVKNRQQPAALHIRIQLQIVRKACVMSLSWNSS
jgi:hypothetical protein